MVMSTQGRRQILFPSGLDPMRKSEVSDLRNGGGDWREKVSMLGVSDSAVSYLFLLRFISKVIERQKSIYNPRT